MVVISEEFSTFTDAYLEDLIRTVQRTQAYLHGTQSIDGYWWGELECNNTMEAEYILLLYFLDIQDPETFTKVSNHIISKQHDDGSWGQYYGSPGDLSTSVECYFALKLSGYPEESLIMSKAKTFILEKGGIAKARVFTKIWLSLFGQWDWRGTPNMLPELMLIPKAWKFSIYKFSSWARPTVVPLLILLANKPIKKFAQHGIIDELYPTSKTLTDYALPKPNSLFSWKGILYRLDQLVGLYQKIPVHPFRRLAEKKLVNWILAHQEKDGLWAGIQPATVYSLIALYCLGFGKNHPAIVNGLSGMRELCIEYDAGMAVQGCISPGWDTALIHLALLESGVSPTDLTLERSARWLMNQQVNTSGDWNINARKVSAGGWPFEFHNDNYPDVDDSALVINGLKMSYECGLSSPEVLTSVNTGANWIIGMQSSSGGWGAFDKDNCSRYLSQLPFSDFGEIIDPPTADVTGHVLEALGSLGYCIQDEFVAKACQFLKDDQEEDGAWFGRWGVNYVYGIGSVLPGLASVGENMDQRYILRAVDWLIDHQNEDGGWGETCGSYADPRLRGSGSSTASQTSWALLALMAANKSDHGSVKTGIEYLISTQADDGTWQEPYFTGTGFPGYGIGSVPEEMLGSKYTDDCDLSDCDLSIGSGLMIRYDLYRVAWPLLTLGRYKTLLCNNFLPGMLKLRVTNLSEDAVKHVK
ncbi:MAG: squalene--hopene cyclase [Chloroflexota bacterium]|nr:squalene--hopene cyclase [Chloroflexota bacterium]